MEQFDQWLAQRGPVLARLVTAERGAICAEVTGRLEQYFPDLCDDPSRPDRERFRRAALERSPERLHTLVLLALRVRSLALVEREYRWAWGVLPRFGVERRHMLAMACWYVNALRRRLPPADEDQAALVELKRRLLRIIRTLSLPSEEEEDR